MLTILHKLIIYGIVLYAFISFSAGLPPFEFNIIEKQFYPKIPALKYVIIALILLFMLSTTVTSIYYMLHPNDVRVLLSKL
jgi:hypothetical protein